MKFQKKHGLEGHDDEEYFEMGRKIGSMWSACSDVYLSPVYSECTENVEELLEADMAEWMTEEFRNKQKEMDGFMNFFSCAQNLTMAWVTDKRPEAIDMMSAYM